MGKFWDEHDLTEFWARTRKAKFAAPRQTKSRKATQDEENKTACRFSRGLWCRCGSIPVKKRIQFLPD